MTTHLVSNKQTLSPRPFPLGKATAHVSEVSQHQALPVYLTTGNSHTEMLSTIPHGRSVVAATLKLADVLQPASYRGKKNAMKTE